MGECVTLPLKGSLARSIIGSMQDRWQPAKSKLGAPKGIVPSHRTARTKGITTLDANIIFLAFGIPNREIVPS